MSGALTATIYNIGDRLYLILLQYQQLFPTSVCTKAHALLPACYSYLTGKDAENRQDFLLKAVMLDTVGRLATVCPTSNPLKTAEKNDCRQGFRCPRPKLGAFRSGPHTGIALEHSS